MFNVGAVRYAQFYLAAKAALITSLFLLLDAYVIVTLERKVLGFMEAFVTALTAEVTAADLWGAVTPLAGLIGVAVIFALGNHYGRRIVGGLGRGKAKI